MLIKYMCYINKSTEPGLHRWLMLDHEAWSMSLETSCDWSCWLCIHIKGNHWITNSNWITKERQIWPWSWFQCFFIYMLYVAFHYVGHFCKCCKLHPSIHALSFIRSLGAGAYPSCLWVRGRVHPGQVISPSQDWHIETSNHTYSNLILSNLCNRANCHNKRIKVYWLSLKNAGFNSNEQRLT